MTNSATESRRGRNSGAAANRPTNAAWRTGWQSWRIPETTIGPLMMTPKKLVVVAPHPDDETLGCGGTIARFAGLGTEVSVLVVSGHLPPLYDREVFEISRKEAEAAFQIMGVTNSEFLAIPATLVRDMPVAKLNGQIGGFIRNAAPEMVLIPFPDRHIDHRVIFDACVVACRPSHPAAPRVVLAYETLSETHWNVPGIEPAFVPELFVDVTKHMPKKQAALECYASQIKSRSVTIYRCLYGAC